MSSLVQTTLFELTHPEGPPVAQEANTALEELAQTNNREVRGAVYTRAEVANFILDLIGFTEDQPLFKNEFWNLLSETAIFFSHYLTAYLPHGGTIQHHTTIKSCNILSLL